MVKADIIGKKPKAYDQTKKEPDLEDLSPNKKFPKIMMKIDKMADVVIPSANFWPDAFSSLAPPSTYNMTLKTLTKVSKVSWASQLLYELLCSSFEWKFSKEKLQLK